MTNSYNIINDHTGTSFGIFDANTPEEAILAMHRDANYGEDVVWLDDDGEIAFCDEEYEQLLGRSWTAVEVEG